MELTVTYVVQGIPTPTRALWWKHIRVGHTLRISHVVGETRYTVTNISLVSSKTVTASVLTKMLSGFNIVVVGLDEKKMAATRALMQLADTVYTDDVDERNFALGLQVEIITTLMKELGL